MGLVHVTLGQASGRAKTGSTLPVPDSIEIGADTLSGSAASQQSDLLAKMGEVWTVTAVSDNIFVKFGSDPVAASGAGHLLLSGCPCSFIAMSDDEKVAFINA